MKNIIGKIWLVWFGLIATPLGILLAYQIDRQIKGHRFYESAFFVPVVLSLAVTGIIWNFMLQPGGFVQGMLGRDIGNPISIYGNYDINTFEGSSKDNSAVVAVPTGVSTSIGVWSHAAGQIGPKVDIANAWAGTYKNTVTKDIFERFNVTHPNGKFFFQGFDVLFGVFFFVSNDEIRLQRANEFDVQLLCSAHALFDTKPRGRMNTELRDANDFGC